MKKTITQTITKEAEFVLTPPREFPVAVARPCRKHGSTEAFLLVPALRMWVYSCCGDSAVI